MEKVNNNVELGFLPHEANFVINALKSALDLAKAANFEYGETVSNSGGDWAFDDPASQAAALEAHLKEKNFIQFQKLKEVLQDAGIIEYPKSEHRYATYGSRVFLKESDGYESVYDLATRSIPGVDGEDEVVIISPESPIATSLFNSSIGDKIEWTAPTGKVFSAVITNIDQDIVSEYYKKKGML